MNIWSNQYHRDEQLWTQLIECGLAGNKPI